MTENPSNLESPFGADLWDVLARYVSHESPHAEAEAVRRWLAADPRHSQLVSGLDRSIRGLAFRSPADLDVDSALRRVVARLDEPQVRRFPVERRWGQGMGNRWRTIGLRAAAVVAFSVIGATVLWRKTLVNSEVTIPAVVPQTYATAVGKTDSVRLPDGSRAVLGPASRLTLEPGYGSARRDVELVGEALFEVLHDATLPFTVRAGAAVIQDIGTTFAVRDDGGEVHVVVTSGSVLLRRAARGQLGTRPSDGVVLNAGDRGSVGPDREAVAERGAATADDLAWTRGRLVFNNAPLPLVRADLRRWYGVELEIGAPSLAGRHLTAAFAGEPAEQVLSIIALALGARIERRGDTALMVPR